MNPAPGVLVAGSGVFGLACALALARQGARVTLADPAGVGDNASGVAAGMIAPAFEALLDGPPERFEMFKAARDLWPTFAAGGEDALGLRRCGAAWVELPGDAPGLMAAHRAGLEAIGAKLTGVGDTLFTPEDWRLAPGPALAALLTMAREAGMQTARAAVTDFEAGRASLSNGEVVAADWLVVATGADRSGLAPELKSLSPIKGQILRFPGSTFAADGPALRCSQGYAAGGPDGLCVGATMEPGRADRDIDPAAVDQLRKLAETLSPDLAAAPMTPLAGVRAASPDGLPMVGPSSRPGVILATGARRNGWLLAPMVAAIVAAQVFDRDAGPYAAAMDARRFSAD